MRYRTDGAWGSGQGTNLSAAEIDRNFYDLAEAAAWLELQPPVPTNGIAHITLADAEFTIFLHNGQRLGPYPLPLPPYRWRGDWEPSTAYDAFDVLAGPGDEGVFFVRSGHTSGGTFDPDDEHLQHVFGPLGSNPGFRPVRNIVETALTLDMSLVGWYLRSVNGCTFTIPTDARGGWIDGANVILRQAGVGVVRLVPAAGVTLNLPLGKQAATRMERSVIYARRVGSNTWDVWGDLAEE